MKAVVVTDYGTPEEMKYMTVDHPALKSNQVLIRVVASSVNFADIKARYGTKKGGSKPPFIPGLDTAGVIEKVGADVRHLKVGQRVIAFPHNGSYAEYVVADESLTFVIQTTWSSKSLRHPPSYLLLLINYLRMWLDSFLEKLF
jgi:NADPH:quinone reductase